MSIGVVTGQRPRRRKPARPLLRLRPGWPLTAVFVGYPLWWVLGVSNFVAFVAAGLMLAELVRRRRILVPPGFGFWLMFLGVVIVGFLLLQVNAPGALPETSHGGIITWAYRLAWYGAATIALLYVGNMRDQLPINRVCRSVGWMFVVIVGGGWLGVLLPTLDFPSLLELVLPRSVTSVEFVHILVHPQVVQLYQTAVTDTPRPSAPFPYTNFWGLNYALFLPFFVVGWWQEAGRLRRALVPIVLALSIVPVVQSLNRGLWLTLGVVAVFAAIRAVMGGKVRMAVGLLAAISVATVVLVTGPAATIIQTRLDNPTSNEGRGTLASQTVKSMVRGSPLVGFGNTRDPQSSFYSVAGGNTADCSLCTPPALGTQGHLWLVLYTQGILGFLLYLGLFVVAVVRSWRLRSPYVTAGLTVLLVHACTSPVYDTVGVGVLAILLAVGLTWREEERVYGPRAAPWQDRLALATTSSYGILVRRHLVLVIVFTALGVDGGLLWQTAQGVSSVGTVSIVLPVEPVFLTDGRRPGTMDDEAQFAQSAQVLDAMSAAVGHRIPKDDVNVTANANTRILNLRYTARTTRDAEVGTAAAATAVLQRRAQDLRDRLASTSASLVQQSAALQAALSTLDSSTKVLETASKKENARAGADPRVFDDARATLLTRAGIVASRLARAETTALNAGDLVRPVTTRVAGGRFRVSLVSGGVLGLFVGLFLARGRELIGRPLRRRGAVAIAGLPLLAQIDRREVNDATNRPSGTEESLDELRASWRRAVSLAVAERPAACVAVRNSPGAALVAGELERWVDRAEADRRRADPGEAVPVEPVVGGAGPLVAAGRVGGGRVAAGGVVAGRVGAGDVGAGYVGAGPVRPGQNGGTRPVGAGYVRAGQNGGAGRVGAGRVGAGHVGAGRVGAGRVGAGRVGAGQNGGAGHDGAAGQNGAGRNGAGRVRAGQNGGTGRYGAGRVRAGQNGGTGQVGRDRGDAGEVGADRGRVGQVGPDGGRPGWAGSARGKAGRVEPADGVDQGPDPDPAPTGVLLVASGDQRVSDLAGARSELERCGQSVVGVVLV